MRADLRSKVEEIIDILTALLSAGLGVFFVYRQDIEISIIFFAVAVIMTAFIIYVRWRK